MSLSAKKCQRRTNILLALVALPLLLYQGHTAVKTDEESIMDSIVIEDGAGGTVNSYGVK